MLTYLSQMNLLPNFTAIVQAVIFFLIFIFMKRFVFEPFLRLRSLRRDETIGKRQKRDEILREIKRIEGEYKDAIENEKKDGFKLINEQRGRGEREALALKNKASVLYREGIEKEKELLKEELSKAEISLADMEKKLGKEIIKRVLE